MFGICIPPGVDLVRICALSGRQGKPPCLWEGSPAVEQATIEGQIVRDARVVRWLARNRLIQGGVATVRVQIDCFSQGRRVETLPPSEVSLLISRPRRTQSTTDAVTLRAFDLVENLVGELKDMVDERDTVIGRLVERGLKASEPAQPLQAAAPEQPKDSLDDLLDKGTKLLTLAQGFRTMRLGD